MNKNKLLKIATSAVMVLLCGCATSPSALTIRNNKAEHEADIKLNQVYDGSIKTIQSVYWSTAAKVPYPSNQKSRHYKITGPAQNVLSFGFHFEGPWVSKTVNGEKLSNDLALKAAQTNDAKLYFYAGYLSPGSPADGLRSNLSSSAYMSYFGDGSTWGKYGSDIISAGSGKRAVASNPLYSSYKLQTQAFHYFQKSAEMGYKPAYFFVGLYYLYGAGVPQNFKQALFYLKKSSPKVTTIPGYLFFPDLFISNIYADRASGYTNYFKAYQYLWLADHVQDGTYNNGTPRYPNDESLPLQGTAVNVCSHEFLSQENDMTQKWIGAIGSVSAPGLGASLPQNFSSWQYGYVGKFLHRLTIEAVKLKYIPALEYAFLISSNKNNKNDASLSNKYLLTLYNTYGDNASQACLYYDRSGIMPSNIKLMRPWPWPCESYRASVEALSLMGKGVPCQQNLEQGPQYIHKAIEMVEARYPAEH